MQPDKKESTEEDFQKNINHDELVIDPGNEHNHLDNKEEKEEKKTEITDDKLSNS